MVQGILGMVAKAVQAARAAEGQKIQSAGQTQSQKIEGTGGQIQDQQIEMTSGSGNHANNIRSEASGDIFGAGSLTPIFSDSGIKLGTVRTSPNGETDTITIDPSTGNRISRVVAQGDKLIMSIQYDPATGKKTQEDDYKDGVLAKTTTINPDGDTESETTYDPSTGKPSLNTVYYNGQINTRNTFDPSTGNTVQSDYYNSDGSIGETIYKDPMTGNMTLRNDFDAQGNVKYTSSWDPSTNQQLSDMTVDPDTGAVHTRKFDADGNLVSEKDYASVADYEQAQVDAVINKRAQNGFNLFQQ